MPLGDVDDLRLLLRANELQLGIALQVVVDDTGHVEGETVAIEYRWAHNQNERLSALAAELVRRRVAVITAIGPAVFAAKAATTTIPIVFYAAYDPVTFGLVASLARPGGNLTGATGLNVELLAKRLELAREVMPTASAMALLVNPTNPNAEQLIRDGREAAQNLGLQLHIVRANTERDIDVAFAAAAGDRHRHIFQ
jgi:putative tryptophan/tyrosine transport system substrate-binding protein